MDRLKEILKDEVTRYAGGGYGANLRLFPILDDAQNTYAVNAVQHPIRRRAAGVMILARIVGDKIVIEEDATDKPLVEALLQHGIPREQIILAYQGEPIPEAIAPSLSPA